MNDSEEREREQLANEIAALMGPLVRDIRAAFLAAAADHALAPGEAQALWLLAARGSMTTKELARGLDMDPANASTLITKLERRGLVARQTAPDDRRKRLVSLTKDGRRLRLRLAQSTGERRPTFDKLTTDELITFRDLLQRLSSRE